MFDITKAKIEVTKVKQYNALSKNILIVNGRPIMIARSKKRIQEGISFLGGDKNALSNDGTLQRHMRKFMDSYK